MDKSNGKKNNDNSFILLVELFLIWNKNRQLLNSVIAKYRKRFVSGSHWSIFARDVLARDEPTKTARCGPLSSWAPKIKTLEKIKNIDFNFQDWDITIYIVKIKIYENSTETFSYVGRKNVRNARKNYDMSGKFFVCPEKLATPLPPRSLVVLFKTQARPWSLPLPSASNDKLQQLICSIFRILF